MAAPAVVVERAYKFYGRKGKADYKPVLEHLDMTVDKGIIYGLLGASGCGKTTLLSCIVGRRKLDGGNIWVLGALVAEFTVRDALYYFGRIYGMKTAKLDERFEFLLNLLDLPSGSRQIKTLSGGQQRRVSLAAAFVHEPELLILDEPTVGLDPATLHERAPLKFDCDTLEDAFLKMALRQNERISRGIRRRSTLTTSPDVIPETVNERRFDSAEDFNAVTSSRDNRYKAVFIKSIQHVWRSSLQSVMIQMCMNNSLSSVTINEDLTCDYHMLSC
ncbi:unnamed protein product [Leptidea sinapis]|uniref:ABC transporter domain-containing protein n=1 Tax=Leptidea sinapis TaxID=189913 RepID=A0A5E4QEX2_9NEOP|nr:unnamed protein product [Leptidea sinapis]